MPNSASETISAPMGIRTASAAARVRATALASLPWAVAVSTAGAACSAGAAKDTLDQEAHGFELRVARIGLHQRFAVGDDDGALVVLQRPLEDQEVAGGQFGDHLVGLLLGGIG